MPAFDDAVAEPVRAHASRADGSQKSRCCGLPDIAFDGAGGGESNRVRVLIECKLFVLCNARNAQNAKRSRFGYAVVTRTRCWLSHQVPKMFFGKFVCMR